MTQPIPSPLQFQALQRQHAEKALMVKMMADLLRVHQQFMDKLAEVDRTINKKIGPKGDAGHTPTEQELSKLIKPFIDQHLSDASLLRLIKPLIPNVKNGNTPTADDLIALIKPLIPKVRHGKDAVVDIDKIAEKVALLIKPEQIETDPLKIIDQIMGLPEGKKLKTKHIDGFEQTVNSMFHQLARGYLSGGGVPSLTAGSNITLTPKSDGGFIVSSSDAPTRIVVTPAGLVNNSNVTFYLPSTPVEDTLDLYLAGMLQTDGVDFTISGQTITFDSGAVPQGGALIAKYVPDTTATAQLLTLTEPTTGALFQFYAPAAYTTAHALVTTCHGTKSGSNGGYIGQMGHDQTDLNTFGGEGDWTVLADQYNFAVISVDFLFDGNPNSGGHSTMGYEQDAADAIRATVAWLQNNGWTPSSRSLNYVTGWSSGASLAADLAYFWPETWSQCVQRHSAGPSSAGASVSATIDNFNFNVKLRNQAISAGVPIGSGSDTYGSTLDTFNWQTAWATYPVQMLVINGLTDDNGHSSGNHYWEQQVKIHQAMESVGYTTTVSSPSSTAGAINKVYTGQTNLWTSTCTIGNGGPSASGSTNYPHACHAQDKELACLYFFGDKSQFL